MGDKAPLLAARNYWEESRQPLTCLVFVAPLLVIYELGTWLLSPHTRNGAEVWLTNLLQSIGVGRYLMLPTLSCAILLGWHHLSHRPWRVDRRVVGAMWIESIVLGLLLVLVAWIQHVVARWLPLEWPCATDSAQRGLVAKIIAYCGAGLYEELLFRLILLSLVAAVVRRSGTTEERAGFVAIVVTSLLFSAAHYSFVTRGGDPFEVGSFVFRFLAGVFFSIVYLVRGFGIAAGSHAMYDVYVALL